MHESKINENDYCVIKEVDPMLFYAGLPLKGSGMQVP